jgi:hypothetical protein
MQPMPQPEHEPVPQASPQPEEGGSGPRLSATLNRLILVTASQLTMRTS